MTDLEARAEQLVEATARAMYEGIWGHSPEDDDSPEYAESRMRKHREDARAALNVVCTKREQIMCERCDGEGTENVTTARGIDRRECPDCHGTKSVPGKLLVVGLIGGELSKERDAAIELLRSWAEDDDDLAAIARIEREAP